MMDNEGRNKQMNWDWDKIKITSWNKALWAITFLIWTIVAVQWVSMNIDAETGERITQDELE